MAARRPPRTKVNARALLGARAPRATETRAPEDNPAVHAIWDVVARIPRGRVSTYGDVARAAGLPGRARLAGFALKHLPAGIHVPWHRVVGAGGRIVFPPNTRAHREQARRLENEGVEVREGRVARSALLPTGD